MDWILTMALINPDTLNLEERVIQTNKVQKTPKGGRTMSWSILVIVGDGAGYVGAGLGKARAIPDAIRKGVEAARKNLVHVPMVGTTIPHDVLVREGGAEILLKPAAPGTGIVAGGSTRAMLEAAGVKDVLGKSLGSSNKVNTAWATMAALRRLKRASDVARLRGKEVGELVSRSVALATMAAEQEDASHGIASVVADQTVTPPVVVEAATPTSEEPIPNSSDLSQSLVSRVPADTHGIEPPSVHPANEPDRAENIPDNTAEAVAAPADQEASA